MKPTTGGMIKYAFIYQLFFLFLPLYMNAQGVEEKYERSSLYMLMIKHPKYAYSNELEYVFRTTDIPNRFWDHSLKVKTLVFSTDDENEEKNIQLFLEKDKLPQRLVSKWFGYNKQTESFSIDLLKERGLYNASALDHAIAERSFRGKSLLEDAGERLINDTYIVFNDIRYVDKSTAWNRAKEILKMATEVGATVGGTVLGAKTGGAKGMLLNSQMDQLGASVSWLYSAVLDDLKGFKVKVTSYLYRLEWNDETSAQFFSQFYTDSLERSMDKIAAYKANPQLFRMKYVGKIENTSHKTTLKGVTTNEDLIRKVCTRALDKNLADLQHEFEEFRVKAPLTGTEPLSVPIGMKENVSENSRYEVLERIEGEDGTIKYKRAGIIRPEKGKIWDNRFMAEKEGTEESLLGYTTFEKVSGGDFYPGMLIREIK